MHCYAGVGVLWMKLKLYYVKNNNITSFADLFFAYRKAWGWKMYLGVIIVLSTSVEITPFNQKVNWTGARHFIKCATSCIILLNHWKGWCVREWWTKVCDFFGKLWLEACDRRAFLFLPLAVFLSSFFSLQKKNQKISISSPSRICFPPSITHAAAVFRICSLLLWAIVIQCLGSVVSISLPFTCVVPLCVSSCAYMSGLPWGRLFLQLTPGCCILTPIPSIRPRSPSTLLFISGRWLEGCWIPWWLAYRSPESVGAGETEDGHFEASGQFRTLALWYLKDTSQAGRVVLVNLFFFLFLSV